MGRIVELRVLNHEGAVDCQREPVMGGTQPATILIQDKFQVDRTSQMVETLNQEYLLRGKVSASQTDMYNRITNYLVLYSDVTAE